METKAVLKSKINWINIVGLLAIMLAYLGENSIIPGTIAGFIIFVLNVIVKKFGSTIPVFQTGASLDWMFYLANFIGALIMIAEYVMENQLFGISVSVLAPVIMFLNLILRTFFTNQYKPAN